MDLVGTMTDLQEVSLLQSIRVPNGHLQPEMVLSFHLLQVSFLLVRTWDHSYLA